MCRLSFFGVFAVFTLCAQAVTSPYATGGEVTVRDLGNFRTRYIHVFTNTEEVATFASTGKRDLNLRYLVVGAGGGRYVGSTMGGGGGGSASSSR